MERRDWTQPVLDLLALLQQQELELLAVNDGEEVLRINKGPAHDQQLAAADAITSVDQAWLSVGTGEATAQLFIVLGNEPDEIVCDWSGSKQLDPAIELAIDEHRLMWEGKPCPYGPNENRYIKAARRIHHRDGEIEVDDWPLISPSDDGGAYVQAWVWVSNDDLAALDLLTNNGNTANHD